MFGKWGSNCFESWDRCSYTGWEKEALAQSFSKSLLRFETCQKSQCSLIIRILTVCLWMQPFYLLTWTQLSFSHEVDRFCWICHTSKQVWVTTHCVSLKCAASADCFSKRNLWSGSLNSKTLVRDLPLESYPTFVYKKRCVRSASVSSQSWENRHELKVDTLNGWQF